MLRFLNASLRDRFAFGFTSLSICEFETSLADGLVDVLSYNIGEPHHRWCSCCIWSDYSASTLSTLWCCRNRLYYRRSLATRSGRMVRESLPGLIYPYNLLPQSVVANKGVASFQKCLQRASMRHVDAENWANLFSNGFRKLSVSRLHAPFVVIR